jgi:hypothetical protein
MGNWLLAHGGESISEDRSPREACRNRGAGSIPVSIAWVSNCRRNSRHAYFLSVERGFEPGHELDDWIKTDMQIGAAPSSRP